MRAHLVRPCEQRLVRALAAVRGQRVKDNVIDIDDDPQGVAKQANNVVNDISRITREKIGLSIRLKSRKDGYIYTAEEPKPRAIKPTPFTVDTTPSLRGYLENSPAAALDMLYDILGEEEFGKMAVGILKAKAK